MKKKNAVKNKRDMEMLRNAETRDVERNIEILHSAEMLAVLRNVHSGFLLDKNPRQIFEQMLSSLLRVTESEYGFIGEILHRSDGTPYLKTLAITNIAWDDETRNFYEENAPAGLEFYNLDTLFGACMISENTVLSNDPANDPRSSGLPEGHPPLNSFLAMPVKQNQQMVGMIGIANRPNGYDEKLIEFLQVFLASCSSLLKAFRLAQQRSEAIKALEESKARLSAIVNMAVDGIISIDTRGTVIGFNPAAEKIFGYAAKEIIGENVKRLMPSPYREEHDQYLSRYLETGKSKIIGVGREAMGQKKNGQIFPLELALSDVAFGDHRIFTGILRDISERKAARQNLEDALEKINVIQNLAPPRLSNWHSGHFIFCPPFI